jgi:DNA helicase II / ATP-dependent DNA helicase PcrA
MNSNHLLTWVSDQKDIIDEIIEKGSYKYFELNKDRPNLLFDIEKTNKECYQLSQGADLCYDRPGIGFCYSLWYHGKRINTFLRYFTQVIFDHRNDDKIILYDLGAGTGAVQWACALIYTGLKRLGINPPSLYVINIDTSPFMLDYNKSILWPIFQEYYPEAKEISISYQVNTWQVSSQDSNNSNHWITASYLFDQSDNADELRKDFLRLLETFDPSKVLLLSSFKKKSLTHKVAQSLREKGFSQIDVENNLLFKGSMTKTYSARNWFKNNKSVSFSGMPTWDESYLYGTVLSNQNTIPALFSDEKIEINLFNPPIKVRREIVLNDKQKEAAIPDGRPAIITGPAGCGKSVVITERIVNLVDIALKSGKIEFLSILVTTFNKELKGYLLKWIGDILEAKNIDYTITTNGIKIKGAKFANIAILHFDILPTRIWKARSPEDYPFHDDQLHFDVLHKRVAREAIDYIKSLEKVTTVEYDNVLNPEYVLDEYHRIIYGLNYAKEEIYLNSPRKGRPRLAYGGIRRKLLFKTIHKYISLIKEKNYSSVYTRRHEFLRKLNKGSMNGLFQHVFVDEFQDCTQSDYTIFYRLIKNPNNLVIAGDYAQAIHLGTVADIPRDTDESTERMRNRKIIRLEGSYRLPYRISEAIQPLSKYIKVNGNEDTDIITPYKGAPPGARPLIVFADNDSDMSEKVSNIIAAYETFDIIDLDEIPIRNISILEKDFQLQSKLLAKKNGLAGTDTILRLKGMEKTCILWSTKIQINDEGEIFNFVYTILTRTSGLLIIAVYPELNNHFKEIIGMINRNRIIIWDNETETYLNNKIYNG